MKRLCIIKLDPFWVLENNYEEVLPVDRIESALRSELNIDEIEKASFAELLFYTEASKKEIEALVRKYLRVYENGDKPLLAIYFEDEITGESKTEDEEKDEMASDFEKMLKAKLKGTTDSTPIKPTEPPEEEWVEQDPVKIALDKINGLISCAEFKALANEIAKIAPVLKSTGTLEAFNHNSYIFAINDGAGYTTYLRLLRDLLCALGLRNPGRYGADTGRDVEEIVYEEDKFAQVSEAARNGNPIISIDISAVINKTNTEGFKRLLSAIEEMGLNETTTVIFKVPYVEKSILSSLVYSLNDILNVRAVAFPPLSVNEIQQYAAKSILEMGFSVDPSAWRSFHERISEEKSDGKFYGLKTVNKVIRELIYNKQLANAGANTPSKRITAKDTDALCVYKPLSEKSVDEMFATLVGGEALRERIYEIVSQVQIARKTKGEKPPCIHMRFVGNPGTGKTTVARIVGKVFKEKGILRLGGFYEFTGRDLVGRFIGETAPKTASICRDAYGSVLFIDEAYSLYRGNASGNDFGREAIDTLIAEMENHRDDMVVIMAGYTDDMNVMMQGNAGLASRVPYTIEFPNFTREQLHQIFVSMLKKTSIGYDERVVSAAKEYFDSLPDKMINDKSFSNGRFVRNLYERTWAKTCRRTQLDPKAKSTIIEADFAQAITDTEFLVKEKKPIRAKIGF